MLLIFFQNLTLRGTTKTNEYNFRLHHVDHRMTFSYQRDLIKIYRYILKKYFFPPNDLKNEISKKLLKKIESLTPENKTFFNNFLPLILLFINIYGIDTNQINKLNKNINELYINEIIDQNEIFNSLDQEKKL